MQEIYTRICMVHRQIQEFKVTRYKNLYIKNIPLFVWNIETRINVVNGYQNLYAKRYHNLNIKKIRKIVY